MTPEPAPQGSRLIAAYDSPRRSLLDRGIALRAAPDMIGFRAYLAARQRAEEIAQAEAAIADGVRVGGRGLRRQKPAEVPDPQLRPVTWAVPRRRNRPGYKSHEVVGPFDIEDAHLHHGAEAHAFVVNADSASPAVCGFRPRMRSVPGGGRVAELAAASLETNRKCPRCLILLYQAALAGQSDMGSWPSADSVTAAEEMEAAERAAAEAADAEPVAAERYIEVPVRAEPEDVVIGPGSSSVEPDETWAEDAVSEDASADEAPTEDYLPVESAPAAAGAVEEPLETAAAYGAEPYGTGAIEADADLEAVAEMAAEYGAPAPADVEAEPEPEPIALSADAAWAPDGYAEDAEKGYADDEALAGDEADLTVEEAQVAHFAGPQLTVIEGRADPLEAVMQTGIDDVLVVTASGRSALVAGGVGRGADWAGSVLDLDEEPVLRRAWSSGQIYHRDGHEPQRICGPYWARAAVLAPVSETVCVVFGASEPVDVPEQLLYDAGRFAAERFQRPTPDVALADEREISIALNRVMAGSDLSFEGALDHVMTTTASVLGCSVAAGVARMGRRLAMRAIDLDGTDSFDPALLLGGGPMLTAEQGVSVEDGIAANGSLPAVVSRLRLPLRGSNVEGLLVVTHTARRPRGFTTQDHRLAQAIAPAAVLVLERAGFGEGLHALESHLRSAPATDPLTGLANKAAFDEALARESERLSRSGGAAAVAAFRIENLQRIDERQGPLARDAALRQAAELVRRLSRSTDLAARVGEDEFRVLVRDGGDGGARRLAVRIRRAAREAQVGQNAPPLSVSWATAQSPAQLLAAGRVVGRRLRSRTRTADHARVGSGRPN